MLFYAVLISTIPAKFPELHFVFYCNQPEVPECLGKVITPESHTFLSEIHSTIQQENAVCIDLDKIRILWTFRPSCIMNWSLHGRKGSNFRCVFGVFCKLLDRKCWNLKGCTLKLNAFKTTSAQGWVKKRRIRYIFTLAPQKTNKQWKLFWLHMWHPVCRTGWLFRFAFCINTAWIN